MPRRITALIFPEVPKVAELPGRLIASSCDDCPARRLMGLTQCPRHNGRNTQADTGPMMPL